LPGSARRGLPDDFQGGRNLRNVLSPHRITVHGGHRGRRLGTPGDDILGQDAAQPVGDADLFGRQWRHGAKDAFQGLFDG
jgi:hypothetical protein